MRTPRQVPDAPRVDSAAEDLAGLGASPDTGHVVEDPAYLRAREVGRQWQSRLRAQPVLSTLAREFVADARRSRVLPDDGIADRQAGRSVPHDGRLPLVRDPNRGELGRRDAGRSQRALHDLRDPRLDLERIVLHPPGLRQDLTMIALREADR